MIFILCNEGIDWYISEEPECVYYNEGLLALPNKNIIKGYFGKLGDAGSKSECSSVVKNVFQTHNGTEKHCKILVDEIHIKPRVQLQGGHLIRFSDDEPEKLAKTLNDG